MRSLVQHGAWGGDSCPHAGPWLESNLFVTLPRGVPPTISQDRGEMSHGGAGGSATFSLGIADFSPLPAIAQNCPPASGGTDPGLYRAGHYVPAPDLAPSRHYLHARAARSAAHRS